MNDQDDEIYVIALRSRFGIGLEFFVKKEVEHGTLPMHRIYDVVTKDAKLFFRQESAMDYAHSVSRKVFKMTSLTGLSINQLLEEKLSYEES